MKQGMFMLNPCPPYDFNLTAAAAVSFREHSGADHFDGTTFSRVLNLQGKLYLIHVRSLGTTDNPQLEARVKGINADDEILSMAQKQIAWLLDTDSDLSPFYTRMDNELVVAPLIKIFRGLHVPHAISIFEALIMIILGQQISSQVAHQLRTKLTQTFGDALKI